MKTRFVSVFLAAVLGIGVLSVPRPSAAQMAASLVTFPTGTVTIRSDGGQHRFKVEIATTQRQMMQGLMFRRHLDADAGMLFVYEQPAESDMWMKNTLIPLDMLFIRKGGKIGKIAERTMPMSEAVISSGGPVIAVLEVNAGTVSRLGIKVGDMVSSPSMPKEGG